MEPTIHSFQPQSIVLQCGADSLGCDRIGSFNLSIAAHGECVRFVKSFGLPLLVLGGGGYRVSSVARCWAYETGILTDTQMADELPSSVYHQFFAPDYRLHPPLTGQIQNLNTHQSLERIRMVVRDKLRYLGGAPSVAMDEIPPSFGEMNEAWAGGETGGEGRGGDKGTRDVDMGDEDEADGAARREAEGDGPSGEGGRRGRGRIL